MDKFLPRDTLKEDIVFTDNLNTPIPSTYRDCF